MWRRVLGVGVVVVTVTFVVPPPATAVTRSHDKVGDAPARYDLTGMSLSNNAGGVSMRSGVRDLQGRGTQVFGLFIIPKAGDVSYHAYSVRRGNGHVRTRLYSDSEAGVIRAPCDLDGRWKPGRNRISLHVPASCLEYSGAILSYVVIAPGNGTRGDPTDISRYVTVPFG